MGNLPNQRHELLRILGPWTAVAMVAGSIIGSGVFKKPQAVAQNIQYFEWAAVAWILGGVLALLGALVLAELVAMLPKAGGNYVFLKEGYGPLWGFLWGWIEFWIMRTGSIAALTWIFSETFGEVIGPYHVLSDFEQKAITIVVILLLTAINVIGIKWGGLVQNITTWLKVGSLVAIAILPFALGHANFELLSLPSVEPKAGSAVVGFGAGVLGVLWAYHGWMNLGPVAEELRDPQRNVPRSLFLGVGIVILTYLCANFAYALVLPQAEMADTGKVRVVAISFAQRLFASWGADYSALAGNAISAAIMVSVLGAANANVIIGSRTYFALGRDGLFPTQLGIVHASFRTPVLALVLQAVWTSCLVIGIDLIQEKKASPFDTITDFVMFGAIIFETMTVVSIFAFRRKHPGWARPYRCIGYPVTPILYAVILAAVLTNTIVDQPLKSAVGFGFILAGAGVFFAYARFNLHEPATSSPRDSTGGPPPE